MIPNKNAYSKVAYILSIIAILAGVLVLLGWQFANYTLKTFGFGGVNMQVNTAISFIFIGLAVIFLQQTTQKTTLYLARIFSLATILLGALVFSQYIFNYNLGIDELLFIEDPNAINTVHPGRMAPSTSFNFILMGLALLLISFNKTKNSLYVVFLMTIVFCFNIFGVIGNIFEITGLAGEADYIQMPLNTSLLFITISIGLLFIMYNDSKIIITVEKKLFAFITIAMVVILFVSVNSIMSIHSLISASNSVHRSEVVKSELNKIYAESYVMVADTRGFLISNNEKFIADWNQSKTNILKSVKNLEALTKDNPTQQKILKTLNQLLKERIEFSELSIHTQKTESLEAANALFSTLKGRQILNKISAAISKMMEEENRQLTMRVEKVINNSDQVLTIIALNIFVQLILLTVIFLFVSKDLTGKRKAQQELQTLFEDLEEIVEKRTAELKTSHEKILKLNAELGHKVKERTEQLTEININLLKEINERAQIENRFKVLVESAHDAIILFDKNGKIQLINRQTENYFGYNRDELIGNNMEILVPGATKLDDINLRTTFTNQPSEHNIGAKHNFFGIKKDGTKIPIEMHLNPIRIQNETLILTSIINITERKKAEEAIKNAKKEADQSNLAKSEFLSRMSHELRTPLNSILGFTQLMGMSELNPSHKKSVDHIMASGKHLLNLVNEVLDLSRIEAGQLSVSLETVELNGIILETLDVVHPLAKKNNIKIEFANIATQQLFVKADHQKLKQVLLNILNNAIKYNKKNGSVTITAENVKNKNARISVTDTGKGIHKDELQKLFMPFQRIGKEISAVEGTGLGLAISKKLTEAMNGNIGIESEVGKGSTFWIELPQSNGLMESHHLEVDFETMPINKTNLAGTLLYIEDNISNQQLVKHIMVTYRSNINLITGLYGRDAIKMAQDYKPNLILLDLNLPDIHGSQVLGLLQKNAETEKIPVVILSADATDKQIEKLLNLGAKAYLVKPLDVLEFLKVIDEMMNDE